MGSSKQKQENNGIRFDDPNIDRGYAWVVMAAVFVNHIIVDGIMYSFGIFKVEFSDYFEASDAKTALVGSMLNAVCLMSAPIASILVTRFGCRSVTMAGGLIATIGCVSSTFCSTINGLLLTYGLITGFGLGMVYLPSVVAVTFYFEKRRGLATGIAVCGSGVGGFLFAPLGDLLLRYFDWKNSMLFVAGVTLQGCLSGALLRPLASQNKRKLSEVEKAQVQDILTADDVVQRLEGKDSECELSPRKGSSQSGTSLPSSGRRGSRYRFRSGSIQRYSEEQAIRDLRRGSASILPLTPVMTELKEKTFSESTLYSINEGLEQKPDPEEKQSKWKKIMEMSGIYLLPDPFFLLPFLCNLVACVGLFVPFFYIVSKAQSQGIETSMAAFLLSIIGISNTLARICVGFIVDFPRVSALVLHNVGLLGCGVLCILSMFARTYAILALFSVTFGICFAAWIALTSVVLCELLGLDKLTHAFGLLTMARGTATLIGPPLAGYVYDLTLNYDNAMHVGGIAFIIGGLIACILHLPNFQRKKASRDPDCVYCFPSARLPEDCDE